MTILDPSSDNNSNVTTTTETNTTANFSFLQYGTVLTQTANNHQTYTIPKEWVLLDSQSTFSVFNNDNLVVDIQPSPESLFAITNGGNQTTHEIATIPNLGQVWFNRESVANILSLAQVRRTCRVTMDTGSSSTITVHKVDGSKFVFTESKDGLYIYDTGISPSPHVGCVFVQSVEDNKAMFTNREIENADRARSLYRALGRPSQQQFEDVLQKNLIMNCPVTVEDARRSVLIYGPDIPALKGKTTKGKPAPHVPDYSARPVPPPILEHHPSVTLCIDFFSLWVNVSFIVSHVPSTTVRLFL